MGDEGPGVAVVFAGVEIYSCVIQIRWYGITGAQNCARFEAAYGDREHVEKGLVAETPVVDLVCYVGYFCPSFTAVGGFEDGEVDEGGFGGVVFPGC